MSTATKWLLAVLVVFNLFLAALMSLLYGYRVSYKNELQQQKQALANVKEQKNNRISDLEAQRNSLQDRVGSLNEQLTSRQDQIDELESQRDKFKNDASEARSRATDLTTQVSNLRNEISQLEDEKQNLQDQLETRASRIAELEKQNETISSRLSEVEANLRQKQVSVSELQERFVKTKSELNDTEQQLASYQDKYGVISGATSAPAVEGNVRAVNPDKNIVLVNLGSKDGLEKGMRLSVIRGDRYVTEIEVVEAYDTWAAARSIDKYQKRAPEIGDVVTSVSPAPSGGASPEKASSSDRSGTTLSSPKTQNN